MENIDINKFYKNKKKAESWWKWKRRNSTVNKLKKIDVDRNNVEYECCVAMILEYMVKNRLFKNDLTNCKVNKISLSPDLKNKIICNDFSSLYVGGFGFGNNGRIYSKDTIDDLQKKYNNIKMKQYFKDLIKNMNEELNKIN